MYEPVVGADRLLVLPRDDMKLVGARNWIKDHATAEGHERHWQLDDNMLAVVRYYRGKRIYCNSAPAFRAVEDFTDRFENVAVSGLTYDTFAIPGVAPYYVNVHVYSCALVNNRIPHRWRLVYNDDTDMCLQVLADGWCTVLVNAFAVKKLHTMTVRGGNTDDLYQGDGRLTMARMLERHWPGVVKTSRRFSRPQHVVAKQWRAFDTPLKLKPGVDLATLPATDEYGMRLTAVREPRSERLRKLVDETDR